MGYRSDDKYILYPLYFDSTITRNDGRRLSQKECIEKPTVEQIAKAAQSLGLHPVVQKNNSHPSHSWKQDGRVLVDKRESKQKLLRLISRRL